MAEKTKKTKENLKNTVLRKQLHISNTQLNKAKYGK